MSKSLEETKQLLSEFSEILNQFPSEAVQVKVIERLLDLYVGEPRPVFAASADRPAYAEKQSRRGRPRKEELSNEQLEENQRNNRAMGATKVLTQLYETGYFQEKRQIGDIIRFSWENLNSDVKATEVSGLLLRFVKEGKLDRDKNPDNNRFEYFEAGEGVEKESYQEMAAN
ncbi:MAG: hypothetical protein INR69_02615 [Mucilaginibacter polytrichastri]|nr:hypothetical protein [Mucilaginibacter polytrichastri]